MRASWSLYLISLFLHIGVFCSIGQSIRVASAYYGSPNGTGVDVTRQVQQFADYGEPFRVGNDTLRVDPSPNHRKALVVIYEVNGQQISDHVQEGDVFYFRNGAEPGRNLEDHEPAIRIRRATYGARGHYVDVTNRIRQLARDRQPFTVSNETFGIDPFPGQQKLLKISYLIGDTPRTRQYAEGALINLNR
jgi:hypothetical protein